MSPLPPPHLTASPWHACPTCGTMVIDDKRCSRCLNRPKVGLLVYGGVGKSSAVAPDPALIASVAGAQASGVDQFLTLGGLSYAPGDWLFIWGAFDSGEQQPTISVGALGQGVPIGAEPVVGSSATIQLYFVKRLMTSFDTGGQSSGTAQVTVENGSFNTTQLGLAAMVVRNLDPSSVIGPLKAASGTSTSPDSGMAGQPGVVPTFLAGCVATQGPPTDLPGSWQNGFTAAARDGSTTLTMALGWAIGRTESGFNAAISGITSRTWIAYLAVLNGQTV